MFFMFLCLPMNGVTRFSETDNTDTDNVKLSQHTVQNAATSSNLKGGPMTKANG
jgi:hypothetical protein